MYITINSIPDVYTTEVYDKSLNDIDDIKIHFITRFCWIQSTSVVKCFKVMKKLVYISTLIVQAMCVTAHISKLKMQNDKPVIRFKNDGTLKIVNFSDL